jgi:hypothetical protein
VGPRGRSRPARATGPLSPSGTPADLLATLAGTVGVRWDGLGSFDPALVASLEEHLPDAPAWERLDALREATLDPADRRSLGAHHTPPDLARRLCRLVVGDDPSTAVVLDPACGGGAFLLAAADRLVELGLTPSEALARVHGIDVDPLAVATARAALRAWAPARSRRVPDVRVRDGLDTWDLAPTVVVGNPPFRSPLSGSSAGGRADELRRDLGAPYADLASLFLLHSLRSVRPGGRVLLIQPESVLSSRDARRVRDEATPHLHGLWVAGERVFGAAVRACAPLLVVDSPGRRSVHRWSGASVRPARAGPRPTAASWSALRAAGVPAVRPRRTGGRLGDLATATAGFRDEFYAIAAGAHDGGAGVPVVTSGLVDPGKVAWGERPARIARAAFQRPAVHLDDIGDERVARWAAARLRPKALVATQTRVVEAAADPDGRFLPLTPVLSVEPLDPVDVWRVAAALTAPQVTAWALRHHGGSALSADAVKLSARQILDAPLPADPDAWAEAVRRFRAGDIAGCGTVLSGDEPKLLRWWLGRLPGARTV